LRFFCVFLFSFFLFLPQATAYHPYWRDHLQKGWQCLLWEGKRERRKQHKTNNTKNYTKRLGEFVSWSVFTAHHQSLTGETTRRRDGVSTFHCYFFPSLLERPLAEGWEEMIGTMMWGHKQIQSQPVLLRVSTRTASFPFTGETTCRRGEWWC
jgi:hypothetical protein